MYSYNQEMIRLIIISIVALFHLSGTAGECPSMDEVPVMYNKETFMCAWLYTGPGSDYAIDACNVCPNDIDNGHYDVNDGFDQAGEACFYLPIGSVIVRPGCQIYLYEDLGFQGVITNYGSGIHTNLQGPLYQPPCPGWKGLKCRCQMTPPVCDPIDSYHTVLQCDNSGSEQTVVTCRYKKAIGTQYETSWSESMSIDASIEVSMKATIYEIFEMSIGTSITTGYNWGTAGSEVFNEQIEYELTVEVLPGLILQIDQAVGACGDNDVKTELFKFIEIDASRNAVNRVWYERTLNNGTTISFNELPLQSRGGPTNIHPMYLELEDTNEEQLDQAVSEAKTLM